MRARTSTGSCFPVGRHYPGIADELAKLAAEQHQQLEGLSPVFVATDKWRELPAAVIDFETTGLDAQTERILEIGIVCVDQGEITDRYNRLINPGMPVPEEARKVHGIGDEELAEAPRFEEVLEELETRLRGRLPVAYNANFDRGFLHAELARCSSQDAKSRGLIPAFDTKVQWTDPLVWSRELLKELRSKKLVDVCAHFGIELEGAHRASNDAEATAKVLLALSEKMPSSYAELVRIQGQLSAQQEAAFARWKRK